jgi:DNA-binding NarL/FixJ family response regulator
MTGPYRVVIVDDQALVRAGLVRILSPEDGFDVVGQTSNGVDAVRIVADLRPDLVCMDVRMRGMDGVEATTRIKAMTEAPSVLILTTFDDDEILWGAVHAGADGFILKEASAEDLINAATIVASGGAWLDPQVTPRILAASRHAAPVHHSRDVRLDRLTKRELDVLRAMAAGATNAEIAAQLFVGEATVKSHVGSLFLKLEVRDRAAAIIRAFTTGLVDPNI